MGGATVLPSASDLASEGALVFNRRLRCRRVFEPGVGRRRLSAVAVSRGGGVDVPSVGATGATGAAEEGQEQETTVAGERQGEAEEARAGGEEQGADEQERAL